MSSDKFKFKNNKNGKNGKKSGFTLMEVLVSVTIAGLVVTAGFKLIAMSYKLLADLEIERNLAAAAQDIWLRFRLDKEMAESGVDEEKNISWKVEHDSLEVEDFNLKYRKITITLNNRSTVIYVAE